MFCTDTKGGFCHSNQSSDGMKRQVLTLADEGATVKLLLPTDKP
jgi:hypothetical protein